MYKYHRLHSLGIFVKMLMSGCIRYKLQSYEVPIDSDEVYGIVTEHCVAERLLSIIILSMTMVLVFVQNFNIYHFISIKVLLNIKKYFL